MAIARDRARNTRDPKLSSMSLELDPDSVCLLIIDMQNSFCHEKGNVAKRLDTEPCRRIISNVRRLKEFCKSRGIPVLYTRQEHWPEDADAVKRLHRLTPKPGSHLYHRSQLMHPAPKGTWEAEFVDQLQPQDDDHIVTKNKFSAFYQTNLEYVLRVLGRSIIIIVGVNTNTCVESTARDAYHRDYDVIVASDCVAAPTEVRSLHDAALENVERYFGFVATSEQLMAALK